MPLDCELLPGVCTGLMPSSQASTCASTARKAPPLSLKNSTLITRSSVQPGCVSNASIIMSRTGLPGKPQRIDARIISPYSTNLTDAEWELVADLFERLPGQRGMPVHYSCRDLVNACWYVLRTGCAWRLLPETFPPGRRSTRQFPAGLVRAYPSKCRTGCANNGVPVWDERAPQAQRLSTRSPAALRRRVAKADSMQARRSRDESATSSSIRWGCSSRSRSPPRACRTGMLPQPWLRKRAPKAPGWKSFIPTARTAANVPMASSGRIIFVSKSFVVQVTARSARYTIQRRHLNQLRLSMRGLRSCPCAGVAR